MSADDLKQRILAWGYDSDDLSVTETSGDGEFALELRLAGADGERTVNVEKPEGRPYVVLTHSFANDDAGRWSEFLASRPGIVGGEAGGGTVRLESRVWLDGLSRNALLQAAAELARSRTAWDAWGSRSVAAASTPESASEMAAATGAQHDTFFGATPQQESPAAEPAGTGSGFGDPGLGAQRPQDSGSDTVSSMPTPTQTPAEVTSETPVGAGASSPSQSPAGWSTRPMASEPVTPQSEPAPAPGPQAWTPTHVVPPTGMPAWAAPDPAQPPVARLDPHLQVQVTETAGGWAHILCSNGWAAWVDNRLLVRG